MGKGETKQHAPKAKRVKTPAQLKKAADNEREYWARCEAANRWHAVVNAIRRRFNIIGGSEDYVLDTAGKLAIKATEEAVARRLAEEAHKVAQQKFWEDTYVNAALNGPHRAEIIKFLAGRVATFDRVRRFFDTRKECAAPALRVA